MGCSIACSTQEIKPPSRDQARRAIRAGVLSAAFEGRLSQQRRLGVVELGHGLSLNGFWTISKIPEYREQNQAPAKTNLHHYLENANPAS
jgi:hypothetical protein